MTIPDSSLAVPSGPVATKTYALDPEHWKLRAAVFGTFIGVTLGVMVVFSVTFGSEGISVIGILAGLVAGYLSAAAIERGLKGRWHSARQLRLTPNGLQIAKGSTVEQEVSAATTVTPLRWKFQVTRRARVPKGWWMYALSLASPDRQITVYTFMSPKDNETFSRAGQFARLLSKREREKAAEKGVPQNLRQAGEERRLREAEEHRWLAGGEMAPADFTDLLNELDRYLHEWTPLAS